MTVYYFYFIIFILFYFFILLYTIFILPPPPILLGPYLIRLTIYSSFCFSRLKKWSEKRILEKNENISEINIAISIRFLIL